MKTLAVIGASYLQLPLVRKAKEMGLQLQQMTLAQMDEFWNEAKTFENQS